VTQPERRRSTSTYDIFVVHAAADEPFVQGYLLAELGLPPERVARLPALQLGGWILEEIERCVESSRITVVVLSRACMDDHWVEAGQLLAAHASASPGASGALLPLLLEDCPLPVHMESRVKLDFRDPSRSVWNAEIDRLREYLGQPMVPTTEVMCPYRGMQAFTERDADRFFGRDAEIDRLIRWICSGHREIYIVGASGSGKTSLISAGLVPRLVQERDGFPRFHVRRFRPGEHPLDQLATALGGNTGAPRAAIDALLSRSELATALLLVIDQLEELFTLSDDRQRRDFFTALTLLRAEPRCVMVFALREDFRTDLLNNPSVTVQQNRIRFLKLEPLRGENLRASIEQPARDLDVYFERELISRLLDEADEPGAQPLLQETLLRLWKFRRQRLLTLADYHALGDGSRSGLAFALSVHAEEVLRGLPADQQTIALRILLRLISFGEGRADTRRQQPRDALHSIGDRAPDFNAVLQHLVANRLVITSDDKHGVVHVDLAHEVLIQAWTRFAEWIATSRAHEQRRRELELSATAWRVRGGKARTSIG
jgi:hypothetical protein